MEEDKAREGSSAGTNGGKVSVVAWRAPWGVYWVSNTLTDTLSPHQMIGIAGSLTQG